MAKSEFENFKHLFFEQLKNNNKRCIDTVIDNGKLINEYINGSDPFYCITFVNDIVDYVVETKDSDFKLLETILKLGIFKNILEHFRNSTVLIRACKDYNKNAVTWACSMDIDQAVQDVMGMTALMYAAKITSLNFLVKNLVRGNPKFIHLVDREGNNALFYATGCPVNLPYLLDTNIDKEHLNNRGETAFLYACRNDYMRGVKVMIKNKGFDIFHYNLEGKNYPMYLVENARYPELESFFKKYKKVINPNFKNKAGQGLVYTFVNKYYERYVGDIGESDFKSPFNYVYTKNLAYTLRTLIQLKCDFNVPVDEDGNTAIMAFLMMKDYVSAKFLLDKCKNKINLSKTNKWGMNASFLIQFIDQNIFDEMEYNKTRNSSVFSYDALKKALRKNTTFDKKYFDSSDEDIFIEENIKNKNIYKIESDSNKPYCVRHWVMEVLYPDAGGAIHVGRVVRVHPLNNAIDYYY